MHAFYALSPYAARINDALEDQYERATKYVLAPGDDAPALQVEGQPRGVDTQVLGARRGTLIEKR